MWRGRPRPVLISLFHSPSMSLVTDSPSRQYLGFRQRRVGAPYRHVHDAPAEVSISPSPSSFAEAGRRPVHHILHRALEVACVRPRCRARALFTRGRSSRRWERPHPNEPWYDDPRHNQQSSSPCCRGDARSRALAFFAATGSGGLALSPGRHPAMLMLHVRPARDGGQQIKS